MAPSTADAIQAACKKTLTSAAFAKFMGAAVQSALQEAADKPSGIALAPMMLPVRVRYIEHLEAITVTSADSKVDVTIYRGCTDASVKNRSIWWGGENREDADGVRWCRTLPHYVQDDFGQLVEVAR